MKKGLDWRGLLGWTVLIAITAVAAWLRFTDLDLKPLHHDEGVNAWFTKKLVEELTYRYNPFFYHGPLLYFLTAPFLVAFGFTAEAMRFAPALFGTLVVPAFVLVRERIGWMGVLACALLMAIAPVEVYFSRTAIHEIYNGVFNVTLAGGFYVYWRRGARWGLVLSLTSLALLFATKETTALTVAAVVPALIAVAWFARPGLTLPGGDALPRRIIDLGPRWWTQTWGDAVAEPWPGSRAPTSVRHAAARIDDALEALRAAARDAVQAHEAARAQADAGRTPPPPPLPGSIAHLIRGGKEHRKLPYLSFVLTFIKVLWYRDRAAVKAAVVVALIFWALLFSSFGTNPVGLGSFFAAFFGWGDTGVEGKGHEKVWHYFMVKLLWPYYKPLLFVGLPGLIWGSLRRDAFSIFNAVWFALALAAYSIIPYKTPWCVISFVTPLFFGVGLGVAYLVEGAGWIAERLRAPALRPLLVALPLLAVAWPTWTYARASWDIQFVDYDVDGHSFVYVQNIREFMDLVQDLDGVLTAAEGDGLEPSVFLIRSKNPLRWYLVDHPGDWAWIQEFKEDRVKDMVAADLIIAQRAQAKELKRVLKADEYVQRWYHERPGQKFDVWIRKPLWERYLAAVERGEVKAPTADPATLSYSDIRTRQMRGTKPPQPPAKKAAPSKPQRLKDRAGDKKGPKGAPARAVPPAPAEDAAKPAP